MVIPLTVVETCHSKQQTSTPPGGARMKARGPQIHLESLSREHGCRYKCFANLSGSFQIFD